MTAMAGSYHVALVVAPDASAALRRAAEHAGRTLTAAGHVVHLLSPPSAGPPSAGPPSAGPPSAGPPSAGPPSAGPPSAGPPSAGPPSASPPSAGPPSAGPPSASPPSAGLPTAGLLAADRLADCPAIEAVLLATATGGCEGLSILRRSGGCGGPLAGWPTAGRVQTSLVEVGARAADHLLAHNRRQLAVITNARQGEPNQALVHGFVSAVLREPGERAVLIEADGTEQGGRAAVEQLLSHHRGVDGIFAADARSALGAITALRQHGVSMPAGVAVVGYGSPAESGPGVVALTTVDLASEQLGQLAARLVVSLIEGRRPGGWHVDVPPAVVARRSAPTPPRLRQTVLH